jgi:hypothetical protein
MKWVIASVAAVVVAFGAIVYLQSNHVKITYVNGLPPYTALPGMLYVVEKDCYVFKLKDANSDWPYVGSHEVVPALPETVSAKEVGADLPGVRILDVIHIGDHFRIASVRRDESKKGTKITFEVLLDDDTSRKYGRLDTYWIMDDSPEASGGAPTIRTEYAVPLRKT